MLQQQIYHKNCWLRSTIISENKKYALPIKPIVHEVIMKFQSRQPMHGDNNFRNHPTSLIYLISKRNIYDLYSSYSINHKTILTVHISADFLHNRMILYADKFPGGYKLINMVYSH